RYMDAYLLSWIIELATDRFCQDFLDYRNDPQGKTSAQMNHAARSGSRNFAEGSERLMTSTSSGLDLLNVAKGSLAELRDDYLKWLMRHDELPWDEPEAVRVRRIAFDPPTPSSSSDSSVSSSSHKPFSNRAFCAHVLAQQAKFKTWLEDPKSTVRANALVILCTRACIMMESYIRNLGESFKHEGGFREKMGEARREQRTEDPAVENENVPHCELCGSAMRQLRRKADNNPFWGCSNYPGCRGTRPYAKA
ncbi:MAG: four helix bundle suffix domain-containing protein, partial [bacterium]